MTTLIVFSCLTLVFGCGAMLFAKRALDKAHLALESSSRLLGQAISERAITIATLHKVTSCEGCEGWSDVHLCIRCLERRGKK